MLRGLPHLSSYMPGPKDARRLLPDPENEPDFYKISELYPLPGGDAVTAVGNGPRVSPPLAEPSKNSRLASEVHTLIEARPSKMTKTDSSPLAAPASLGLAAQVGAVMARRRADLLNAAAAQAQLELQAQLMVQQRASQAFTIPRQDNNMAALAELLRLRGGSCV